MDKDQMDPQQVGAYWDENAPTWTELSRAGYDVYRDYLNTPAFLVMLGDISNLKGIDLGCGEGHNTRLLAKRQAVMTAIDISPRFIKYAHDVEDQEPLGITYQVASATDLPFATGTFDFATAFMSLMDMPDTELVFQEAYRVLKPGGFLQFSITHPCTTTPHRRNLRDATDVTYALELGRYFEYGTGQVEEWIFSAAPEEVKKTRRPFRVPVFHRTLSQWINTVVVSGFVIERVEEPRPTDESVSQCPAVQDAQIMPYFLHMRCRKPGL